MGTVITPEEWLERPGSVGRPALGSTIKILDDDGIELPAGETGLIYIGSDWGRGFRYAGPDELTESIYRGDLATLGDVGYVDDDGYLFVVDRRKDMVITGGANVYPAEVEAVLVRHPERGRGRGDRRARRGVRRDRHRDRRRRRRGHARGDHRVRPRAPRRVQVPAPGRARRRAPRDPMGKIRKRDLRQQYS